MIFLVQEFIDELSLATFSFPIKFTDVFDQSVNTYPECVITEINNTVRDIVSANDRDDSEASSTIAYQFDIYATDDLDGSGNVVKRTDILNILTDELSKWMWKNKGLARTLIYTPTLVDDAVVRRIVRYSGVIDNKGYIYTN